MRIVEPDFILNSSNGFFDLYVYKKVKNKETEEIEVKPCVVAYGCSLASALNRIIKKRVHSRFSSENPCLLDALNEIIKQQKEIIKLCKESLPEKFDTGD